MSGKRYMYDNGDQVWSFEGKSWFITTTDGETKPIKKPNWSRVVLDLTT